MVTRAVFLDRDGVINANVNRGGRAVAPTRFEDFKFLPGVEQAISQLSSAGFKVIVITNQPDIATGRTKAAVTRSMHDKIRKELKVDDIKICTHTDADNCTCRKPKPGMLVAAAAEWGIDLRRSYVVGDSWRDIEAGHAVGCLTVLVDWGLEQEGRLRPDKAVGSLAEAAGFILRREASGDQG